MKFLLRCGVVAAAGWMAAGGPTQAALDAPLVLTQVPRSARTDTAGDAQALARTDWMKGARLVLLSAEGQVRVLSEDFESACDPNISFDGQRILFAGRKSPQAHWRVWEVGLDGRNPRAITPEHLEARSPIHVSTLFTLDSPEPWLTLVFVGREQTLGAAGDASASSLYNIKLDGTELRRLTFNPNPNFDPFQMWDGRVVYAAEHHPKEPGAGASRVGLYAIHIEGADMERYGGERGGWIQHMPCATERGLVIFVEPATATGDGAGQLACVEERRPHVTYRKLTGDGSHAFLYPSPLRDNRVLVSRRPARGQETGGVFCFDADTGQCEPVFDSPDFHDLQAVLVKPRNRPDGHSTVVTTTNDFGTFYGLNCYDADPRMAPHLSTGMVKRVRFIEGVLPAALISSKTEAPRDRLLPRRLVGEAPVEPDGSFNVMVPADTPLLLQTLDERGLALGTCGWIWVKPKETRGCIGCHEDPERIPENEYVLSLRRPSNRLLLPPSQRRRVAFRSDIAPILQKHCATADCHGGHDTPLHLPLSADKPAERDLQQAYETLTVPAEQQAGASASLPVLGKYVDRGRARTSWLVWQVTGTNTSRPWDRVETRKLKPMPPPGKGLPLSAEDLRTLIQWVDMGAQFNAAKPVETGTK